MTEKILFYVYRDSGTSSEHLVRTIVEELKNFVFSGKGISFTSKGYSGIPLLGELPIDSPEDDIWKVLSILFKISAIEEGLIFKVQTEDYEKNPLVIEARTSDVLPNWATNSKKFAENIFGMNGVIHLISPTVSDKFAKRSQIDMLRAVPNETRNILVTESLSEKLNSANSRNFGMHNTSINVPVSVAYVARERPDILSLAIREFIGTDEKKIKELEKKLVDEQDRVMIHTTINDTDWKEVTAVADIESPTDIVSHRVSLALLAFDEKHASIPNGVHVPVSGLFQKVGDRFEREHLESLRAQLFGTPQSATHLYQTAKALVTGNHIQECRKIFVDEGSTSNRESDCSGNEEDNSNAKYAKKQVFKKKKRSAFGKKRELAAIIDHTNAPELPVELEYATPENTAALKKFERAVNGDDYYKASSDEYSLGEEEDLELFMAKPRKKILEEMKNKNKAKLGIKINERLPTVSDDEEIDVADMLRAAPPIANAEDIEDFDDI